MHVSLSMFQHACVPCQAVMPFPVLDGNLVCSISNSNVTLASKCLNMLCNMQTVPCIYQAFTKL
jgi:hypothetical protein